MRIFAPFARVMIAQGVTIADATETLKRALVLAAEDASGTPPTDSRISLQTGLHRKDVKRLRADVPKMPRRPMLNATTLAVAVWTTHADYTTRERPRALTRQDFDSLIRTARIDLPPATVLRALLDDGRVSENGEGLFALSPDATGPSHDAQSRLAAFSANISAHATAAADNLITRSGHFERAGHYNNLSPASVEKLRQEAEARLGEVLLDLNRMALALQDDDEGGDGKDTFTAGAYVHSNPKGSE